MPSPRVCKSSMLWWVQPARATKTEKSASKPSSSEGEASTSPSRTEAPALKSAFDTRRVLNSRLIVAPSALARTRSPRSASRPSDRKTPSSSVP